MNRRRKEGQKVLRIKDYNCRLRKNYLLFLVHYVLLLYDTRYFNSFNITQHVKTLILLFLRLQSFDWFVAVLHASLLLLNYIIILCLSITIRTGKISYGIIYTSFSARSCGKIQCFQRACDRNHFRCTLTISCSRSSKIQSED
jgi:hypothetical protein